MKKQNTRQKIRAIKIKILPILKNSGVVKSAIFGSFATGQATQRSDVDILVDFPKTKTLLDLVDLQIKLSAALKRKVDLITYRSLSPLIEDIILKEQIPIYEKRSASLS